MKIVKFTRAKVSIKTNDEEFSKIRLNDLLSLSDGEVELVATVESITDNESEIVLEEIELENMECPFLKRVECSIIGSVINGDFRQQIDQYLANAHRIADPKSALRFQFIVHVDQKSNPFALSLRTYQLFRSF